MTDTLFFAKNSVLLAKEKMDLINPDLSEKFQILINFLSQHPESCSTPRSKRLRQNFGKEEHIDYLAKKFNESRLPKKPTPPTTVSDEVVSLVLNVSFGIPQESLERIKEEHRLSMASENIVGDLLERYLAEKLEPSGWIWCSGTSVKYVDFIHYDSTKNEWGLLQVKNRDNTENSSSNKIRNNTPIKKWFRTYSQRDSTNWENFPDEVSSKNLNENDFRDFVKNYLINLN
ncbi:SinI family restriction endonuclease [Erwinia persicina]|uniref:SinI family restriction endonuclease n=1 Tax=Erwinia persicina TaxID=55211 RepID=UPI0009304BB2|nr:SinI family restriction endonuclease [Erwinia persicina]MBC3945034.1 SinI family restriction endonuclease [Erwinia persicina]MCQ4103287.1 SinI family restriction endonuclease [Erwinia persicina]UTX13464.1 SinI family restriction endonuclease [Erwinia persicina]